MKKQLTIIMMIIFSISLLLLTACSENDKTYVVTFISESDETLYTQTISANEVAMAEALPDKKGYTAEWRLKDKDSAYDFKIAVNEEFTLKVYYIAKTYSIELCNKFTFDTEKINTTYNKDMPQIMAPTELNYTFNGYYSEEDGKGEKYYNADGTSAKIWNLDENDIVLFAYFVYNPDETAPIISGSLTYDVVAGVNVTLDLTANDDRDGDLTNEIAVTSANGASYNEGLTFAYELCGTYFVEIEVTNADELKTIETVTINVSSSTAETDIGDFNNLNNIADNIGFKENFENASNSELLKNASGIGYSLSSSTKAINGTSLIIDTVTNSGCSVMFTNTAGYLLADETYEISFQVKLISGQAAYGFFLGTKINDETQTNIQKDIHDMVVDEIRTLNYTITNKSNEGSYFMYLFTIYDNYNTGIYAIDNLTIDYKYLPKKDLEEIGGTMSTDFEDYNDLASTGAFGDIYHQGTGDMTVTDSVILGNKALKIDNSISNGNNAFFFATNNLPLGNYRVSFDIALEIGSMHQWNMKLGEQYLFSNDGYQSSRLAINTAYTVTCYFTVSTSDDCLSLNTGSVVMYIDNIIFERVVNKSSTVYALKDLCIIGGSISEDFEETATEGELASIFNPQGHAGIVEYENSKRLACLCEGSGDQIYLFTTQNYVPAGSFDITMDLYCTGDNAALWIAGIQVDMNKVTKGQISTVTFTITIEQLATFIISPIDGIFYFDNMIIKRVA
jgi:hypothetical protein